MPGFEHTRPGRVALGRATVAAALLFAGQVQAQDEAQGKALELGLLPTINVRALMSVYQPLREYLQQRLERPVRLVTASDYRTYIDRTRRRTYRYLITAPHFARLAQLETGYIPLLRVRRELSAVLVTSRATGHREIAQLRGGKIATPDPLAIVSMLGLELLSTHALVPTVDVEVIAHPSFATALYALLDGKARATVTAETALAQMPTEVRRAMIPIAQSPPVPAIMLIARADTSEAERASLTSAFLAFEKDPRSEAFLARTRFKGYRAIGEQEMASLDPYVTRLKVLLNDQ